MFKFVFWSIWNNLLSLFSELVFMFGVVCLVLFVVLLSRLLRMLFSLLFVVLLLVLLRMLFSELSRLLLLLLFCVVLFWCDISMVISLINRVIFGLWVFFCFLELFSVELRIELSSFIGFFFDLMFMVWCCGIWVILFLVLCYYV